MGELGEKRNKGKNSDNKKNAHLTTNMTTIDNVTKRQTGGRKTLETECKMNPKNSTTEKVRKGKICNNS